MPDQPHHILALFGVALLAFVAFVGRRNRALLWLLAPSALAVALIWRAESPGSKPAITFMGLTTIVLFAQSFYRARSTGELRLLRLAMTHNKWRLLVPVAMGASVVWCFASAFFFPSWLIWATCIMLVAVIALMAQMVYLAFTPEWKEWRKTIGDSRTV